MQKSELAIGVFDSGMGGLTVLCALKKALPKESFIYLGDTARLPYGTKSPDTILAYAEQLSRVLVERRIKALVIACNTATTAALPHLKMILPDIPVIGVVEPGANAALSATKNGRILILATETTIASRAYQSLIEKQYPNAVVKGQACSLLVALAEEGMVNNEIAAATLKHYLQPLTDEDTVLLGCTHFPVFKSALKTILPPHIAIVDSAEATSIALKKQLEEHHLLNDSYLQTTHRYLVTDSVNRFKNIGPIFLDEPLVEDNIELIDTAH